MRRNPSGFTLVELMVVVTILSILATLTFTYVLPKIEEAKVATARTQIADLEGAVQSFQMRNGGRLPESLEILSEKDANGVPYIKALPLDPWHNAYIFTQDPNGILFRIGTLGRDGQPGGEGFNADFDNQSMAEAEAKKG